MSSISFDIAAVIRNIVDTVPDSALRITFPLEFDNEDEEEFAQDPDASRISGVSELLGQADPRTTHHRPPTRVPLDPVYLWDLDPALDSALASADGGESFWHLAQNAHRYRDSIGGASGSRSRNRKPSSRRESMPGEIVSMSVKKLVAYIDHFLTNAESVAMEATEGDDSDTDGDGDGGGNGTPKDTSGRETSRNSDDILHRLIAASCLVKMLRLRGSTAFMPFSPASFSKIVRAANTDIGARWGSPIDAPQAVNEAKKGNKAAKKPAVRKTKKKAAPDPDDVSQNLEDQEDAMDIDTPASGTQSSRRPAEGVTLTSLLARLFDQIHLLLCEPAAHARVEQDWDALKGLSRAVGEALANGESEVAASGAVRSKKKSEIRLVLGIITATAKYLPTLRLLFPLIHRSIVPTLLYSGGVRTVSGGAQARVAVERSALTWHWVRGIVERSARDGEREENDSHEEGVRREVNDASWVVFQQIAFQAADRSAPLRALIVPELVSLAESMGSIRCRQAAAWVGKMGLNAKPSYRVFSLDLLAALYSSSLHRVDPTKLSPSYLSLVAARVNDSSRPVRTKALELIAAALRDEETEGRPSGDQSPSSFVMNLIRRRPARATTGTGLGNPDASSFSEAFSTTGTHPATLSQSILSRAEEEKAPIRRAAVGVLVASVIKELKDIFRRAKRSTGTLDVREPISSQLEFDGSGEGTVRASLHFSHPLPATHPMLGMLRERCADRAGSVRKAAVQGMHEVIQVVKEAGRETEWGWIWKIWKSALFPTAFDPDTAIQEEMASTVIAEVVSGVIERPQIMSPLLASLDQNSILSIRHMCTILTQKSGLSKSWVQDVGAIAEEMAGVNLARVNLKDKGKGKAKAKETNNFSSGSLQSAGQGCAEGVWRLYRELGTAMPSFVDVKMVMSARNSIEGDKSLAEDQCGRILEHILELLGAAGRQVLSANGDAAKLRSSTVEKLCRMEVPVRAIPAAVNLILQMSKGASTQVDASEFVWTSLLDAADAFLDLKTIVERPALSDKFVGSLQGVLATSSMEISGLKAQALVGKLAAQNDDLAKVVLPVVARELELSPEFTMRNNAAIVLCDLARYSKSDRYVQIIGNTLADENELVRRQVLQGLTRLLQEEYIKVSPDLFLKIATRISDPIMEVHSVAEYCLVEVLLAKQPLCFYTYFVDCLLDLSQFSTIFYQAVKFWIRSDTERRFTLPGNGENESKRRNIYKFLLSKVNDNHRLQLRQKICTDVIGGVLGGQIDLDSQGGLGQLVDALWILCCPEMKIAKPRASKAGEDDDQLDVGTEKQENALQKLDRTAKSKATRQTLVETMIPILVELKHMLESSRSPIVRNVMTCLRENVKDYRSEINQLGMDKRVAQELEFDLQEEDKRTSMAGQPKHAADSVQPPESLQQRAKPQQHPAVIWLPESVSKPPRQQQAPLSTVSKQMGGGAKVDAGENILAPPTKATKKGTKATIRGQRPHEHDVHDLSDSSTISQKPPKPPRAAKRSKAVLSRQPLAPLDQLISATIPKTSASNQEYPTYGPNNADATHTSRKSSLVIKSSQFSIPRVRSHGKKMEAPESESDDENLEEDDIRSLSGRTGVSAKAGENRNFRGLSILSSRTGRSSNWYDKSFAVVEQELTGAVECSGQDSGREALQLVSWLSDQLDALIGAVAGVHIKNLDKPSGKENSSEDAGAPGRKPNGAALPDTEEDSQRVYLRELDENVLTLEETKKVSLLGRALVDEDALERYRQRAMTKTRIVVESPTAPAQEAVVGDPALVVSAISQSDPGTSSQTESPSSASIGPMGDSTAAIAADTSDPENSVGYTGMEEMDWTLGDVGPDLPF
ncbi:Condensin-2 complex subunit D3 [Gonapodya sp. JEL0774]|nr:Condensin-2 complex subunit D3 [Gonapodya sp. JEL0774]